MTPYMLNLDKNWLCRSISSKKVFMGIFRGHMLGGFRAIWDLGILLLQTWNFDWMNLHYVSNNSRIFQQRTFISFWANAPKTKNIFCSTNSLQTPTFKVNNKKIPYELSLLQKLIAIHIRSLTSLWPKLHLNYCYPGKEPAGSSSYL